LTFHHSSIIIALLYRPKSNRMSSSFLHLVTGRFVPSPGFPGRTGIRGRPPPKIAVGFVRSVRKGFFGKTSGLKADDLPSRDSRNRWLVPIGVSCGTAMFVAGLWRLNAKGKICLCVKRGVGLGPRRQESLVSSG
jgi:hypothetical protein